MSKITIQDLYDLNETIGAELFEGLTYPWDALPKIGEFIKKLGCTLSVSATAPPSSEKERRCATAPSSGATRWWERAPWSAIPPS